MSALIDWLGHGGKPVDRELSQARADICLTCPENRPDSAITVEIAKGIKALLELKGGMALRVAGEKSLHQCAICTCALRLKVWAPMDTIRKHMDAEEKERYPDFCWQRNEL